MKYELVIGVLTYKRGDLLRACIESVIWNTPDVSSFPLVIVNNSTDEAYIAEVEALASEKNVAVISFRRNRGTSAAWNAIARLFDCEKVAILNDDIRVHEGWKWAMDQVLIDSNVGAVSFSWGENTRPFSTDLRVVRYECIYPCGAFLMMRKDVFDHVGGFDENLWISLEEVDFGIRATQLGYVNANLGADGETYKFAIHLGGGTGYAMHQAAPELLESALVKDKYFETKHDTTFPLPQEFENRCREIGRQART